MKTFSRIAEAILWNARFVTLVAVVASLIGSLAMFYIACVDVGWLLSEIGHYLDHTLSVPDHESLRVDIISFVVKIADILLFAVVMLIFAVGIYELFIGRIDAIERAGDAGRVLQIHSIDDLKERLAKVIFLILIVNYFEYVLDLKPKTPLDLLYLAVGVVLIALGMYLTKAKSLPEE